jgi:microcystin-dependent protein
MVNVNIKDGIDTLSSINNFIPVGSLMMKASAPSALSNYDTDAKCLNLGYIPCDGRTLNAVTYKAYQDLFDVIGNLYGGTNNSNFKVPDLRTSRRYVYGQPSATSGIYTPSLSANTTNAVTHSHTAITSSTSISTNGTAETHTHSTSYSFNNGGSDNHNHTFNSTMPGLSATNAVGTTLTKADGTGTAAGAAHGHSTGAFNTSAGGGNGGLDHAHSGSGTSGSHSQPTHTHTVGSVSITTPNSAGIDIPYINVLYFIKI